MTLTNKDKKYLLSVGYLNKDLIAIKDVTKNIKYSFIFISGRKKQYIKLNQKQVIGMLGREAFLSGIGRAVFHNSAVCTPESLPNVRIYFEKKKF